jgi:uncharacterized protein with HEPN domain
MYKRNLLLYITDILDSINAIESFLNGMSYKEFSNDRKTYSAILREFIVIGEAISKITDILESKHPDYPWQYVKDFRNFIVHEYFGIDSKIVYDAATIELKELKIKIQSIDFKDY